MNKFSVAVLLSVATQILLYKCCSLLSTSASGAAEVLADTMLYRSPGLDDCDHALWHLGLCRESEECP